MKVHLTNNHPELVPTEMRSELVCSICGKVCLNRQRRALCEAIHNKDFKFKCHHCDKGFHDKHTMKRHIQVHTGEKPFKCSECDQSFKTPTHLKTHYNGIHLGLLKYECQFCHQKFKWMACRNTHSKSCSMKI